MKKIAVGAFPLVHIDKSERKMVENYLINTLSDLINVNQLATDINSDRARFITPMSILNFIKNNKFETEKTVPESNMEKERSEKLNSIRRAFKNTKTLYSAISNDPFYRDNVFYPIYIEETIKSGNYTDYKYDFLILSNDLVKKQILDEIQYDDRITLLFLILKCILLPNTKLSNLGTRDSSGQVSDIRKYFAVYLETCKNANINPIDMFVKIINFSGIQKRSKKGGKPTNKLLGLLTSKGVETETINKIHSANFLNLFDNDGEIKDAYFLTGLSQGAISKFLDDDSVMDPNYNIVGRQYAQAKTHEYGKILSIVDALKVFNSAQNMVQDLNSSDIMQKVKLANSKNGEETEVHINVDQILNDIETIYFRQFLTSIQNLDFITVKKIYNTLGFEMNPTKVQTEEEKFNKQIDVLQKELDTTRKEMDTLRDLMNKNRDSNGNVIDMQLEKGLVQRYQANEDKYQKDSDALIKAKTDLQVFKISNASNKDSTLSTAEYLKRELVTYLISLEEFSAYLTGLYAQLYSYFNSEEFLSDLQNNGSKMMELNDFKNLGIYKKTFQLDLAEISSLFKQHYLRKFDLTENNILKDEKTLIKQLFSKQSTVDTKIDSVLSPTAVNVLNDLGLDIIFFENLIRPIFKKYSNAALVTANQIKDLRIEKNPLLKKLFSNANLFKSFILTDDILIQAYDILHYLDNLKYEVGLINSPVSKVFNDQNKIQFMINRLGMNDYPVFIMNRREVSLSMPNHLSMTGNNFISTVSASAFREIATINHVKVWSQVNMFGGVTNSKNYKELEDRMRTIKADIAVAEKNIAQEKDKKKKIDLQRKLDKLKAEQEKKRIEQQKLKELASNPYNFSPNMEKSVRSTIPERPGQNQFNVSGQPQNYQQQNVYDRNLNNRQNNYNQNGQNNYNQNGQNNYRQNYNSNYNPNETRDNFMRGRDNVDGIQQQPIYDEQHRNQNPQFQNNRFINNPYIQNRMNELNNKQY